MQIGALCLAVCFLMSCSEVKDFSSNPQLNDSNDIEKPGTNTHTQSAKAEINGELGGSLAMTKNYVNPYGEDVTVTASLTVPEGAYSGTKNISITSNDKDLSITFSPKSEFIKPLKLSLSFTGVNLARRGIDVNKTVDFYYIYPNGKVELVKNNGIIVNVSQGRIEVNSAELNHFSRYAFSNKKGGSSK